MALLFVSCEKELFHYAEISEYHAESQQLDVATTDSIARFSSKVHGFVAQHPDAKDDPLYPEILENINMATLDISDLNNEDFDELLIEQKTHVYWIHFAVKPSCNRRRTNFKR